MLSGGVVKRKPLSLMSKGEEIKELFPSMQKREIVENIVVIDVKGVQE